MNISVMSEPTKMSTSPDPAPADSPPAVDPDKPSPAATPESPPKGNENTWRYVSLITLTLQNAILGLSMRYARTRPGDLFLSSTGECV